MNPVHKTRKVWVWSPPRMGGTSVAAALDLLGYKTNQVCVLTRPDVGDFVFRQQNLLSNWSLVSNSYQFGNDLVLYAESCKRLGFPVILLEREKAAWKASLEPFLLQNPNFRQDLSEITAIYEKLLLIEHEDFYKFNVIDGWLPLCRILGEEVPEIPFPRLNAGAYDWSI